MFGPLMNRAYMYSLCLVIELRALALCFKFVKQLNFKLRFQGKRAKLNLVLSPYTRTVGKLVFNLVG